VSPEQILAIAAGFEFPALFVKTAVALERGRKMDSLLTTRLPDGAAKRVGIKQHHDLDASGGSELPDELGCQLRGLLEREPQCLRLFGLHIKPEAPGDDVVAAHQDGTHILVSMAVGVAHGVLHLGHGIQALALLGLLGIIDHQVDGCARPKAQALAQLVGLLAQGGLGIPACPQEKVLEARPVVRGLQLAIDIGHIPSPPHNAHRQDQQAAVCPMVPAKVRVQGAKKVVEGGGHTYDTEHEVILPRLLVSGRVHTLLRQGPRMASSTPAVKPSTPLFHEKSVNMRQ
jgi:hypothetical protein